MATVQTFLDNLNGLPALWQRISSVFAKKEDVPNKVLDLSDAANYALKTEVDSAITSKGYQTSGQVDAIVFGKGYQTSSQIDSKIATAMTAAVVWKGSVVLESNLPQNPAKGDMYNISPKSSYGPAGTNVVWNGTAWDAMSGIFALEAMTAEEIISICK